MFPLSNVPGQYLAAPDLDQHAEVRSDPSNGGGKIVAVPDPELIGPDACSLGTGPGSCCGLSRPRG